MPKTQTMRADVRKRLRARRDVNICLPRYFMRKMPRVATLRPARQHGYGKMSRWRDGNAYDVRRHESYARIRYARWNHDDERPRRRGSDTPAR